jgi:hypothetical protein
MLKRFLMVALTLLGLIAASSSAAQAAEAVYMEQVTGPTVFQTNRDYTSSAINSPAGTPSSGSITSVVYKYAFNGSTPPGLQVQLCNLQRCVNLPTYPTQAFTDAFAGDPAVNQWKYKFRSVAATTYVFKPNPYYGGIDSVTAYYTTP